MRKSENVQEETGGGGGGGGEEKEEAIGLNDVINYNTHVKRRR